MRIAPAMSKVKPVLIIVVIGQVSAAIASISGIVAAALMLVR